MRKPVSGRRGALALAPVLIVILSALATAPEAGAAKKFKVLGGSVTQTDEWSSNSSSDNGCYTGTYTDFGSFDIDLKAKRDTVVKLVRGEEQGSKLLKGLKFTGKTWRGSVLANQWDADTQPPRASCGQPTGPFYDPPSTDGCGAGKISAANSNLAVVGKLDPGLVGTFYTTDPLSNCPTEDPLYATEPILADTGQPASIWNRRRIRLKASKTVDDPNGIDIYYRGPDHQSGTSYGTISWDLTLKRLGSRRPASAR